jgi:DNA-directed RNA polymerase specialized sigma subunit
MAFEELATLLGISKGRISQLHKRALQMIRIEYENTERLDAHY